VVTPATTSAAIAPTATALPASGQYRVAPGDTLWDIAVRFQVSLDEMIAANPGIDPELLHPGDVLNIPSAGAVQQIIRTPVAAATPDRSAILIDEQPARVGADSDGLRLRKGPSTNDDVLTRLEALTPLTLLARSADGVWLQVLLSDGTRGWVMAQYVDTRPASAPARLAVGPGKYAPISTQSLPNPAPYLSGFTMRAKEIFVAGQARGNRANVFVNIGDSNSASPLFLEPFDTGDYDLGAYGYLQDSIRYFRGSFRFTSVAAVVGFDTLRLRDPARANSQLCQAGESALACEYRLKKPSVALILIGTNDTANWQNFEANYRPIIEYTIGQGIIPVLITKGDDLESTKYKAPPDHMNEIIVKLSREYGIPLLDLYQLTAPLPNHGFVSDGFHFNIPPDSKTAHFTGAHLNYGYTLHNLAALQALDAVRRLVLE
jgi:LysM repeat protein